MNDSVYYRKLFTDLTTQYSTEVKQCVDSMIKRGVIEKKVKNFLVLNHQWTTRLSFLPKYTSLVTHCCLKWCPDGNISCFTDHFLWSSMLQLPSYIQDTRDFINELGRLPQLPPGYLLVTLSISSLYTNIPHEEGITACEEYMYLKLPRVAGTSHSQSL